MVVSPGLVNEVRDGDEADAPRDANGFKTPEYQEDIRHVVADIGIARHFWANAFGSSWSVASELAVRER